MRYSEDGSLFTTTLGGGGGGGDASAANQELQIAQETDINAELDVQTALLQVIRDRFPGALVGGRFDVNLGNRNLRRVGSSFTRPADTTAYAVGDNIADSASAPTVNTLAGCATANGGGGIILDAMLIDSANQGVVLSPEVWVFANPWTPDNDNAPFTPSDAEAADLVAILNFSNSFVGDATAGAGGNRVFLSDMVSRAYLCAAGSTSLYWALVCRNAYVPVSGEQFTLRLSLMPN